MSVNAVYIKINKNARALSGIQLRKRKALRNHCLHGEVAALVLLKLFISGNKGVTPLPPPSA